MNLAAKAFRGLHKLAFLIPALFILPVTTVSATTDITNTNDSGAGQR